MPKLLEIERGFCVRFPSKFIIQKEPQDMRNLPLYLFLNLQLFYVWVKLNVFQARRRQWCGEAKAQVWALRRHCVRVFHCQQEGETVQYHGCQRRRFEDICRLVKYPICTHGDSAERKEDGFADKQLRIPLELDLDLNLSGRSRQKLKHYSPTSLPVYSNELNVETMWPKEYLRNSRSTRFLTKGKGDTFDSLDSTYLSLQKHQERWQNASIFFDKPVLQHTESDQS